MSRALVALDSLRELTDGSDADLARLMSEVVAQLVVKGFDQDWIRVAGPWVSARVRFDPTWSRAAIMRPQSGSGFPGIVERVTGGKWTSVIRRHPSIGTVISSDHDSPEAARAACDSALRAEGWVLLG